MIKIWRVIVDVCHIDGYEPTECCERRFPLIQSFYLNLKGFDKGWKEGELKKNRGVERQERKKREKEGKRCKSVKERETERQKGRERRRDKERETETERERDRQTDRQTYRRLTVTERVEGQSFPCKKLPSQNKIFNVNIVAISYLQ